MWANAHRNGRSAEYRWHLCSTPQSLAEIFREGWQWASEQMIKFWWRSESPIRLTDPDPYHDTGKTCLGGGMHCPSASSYFFIFSRSNLRS